MGLSYLLRASVSALRTEFIVEHPTGTDICRVMPDGRPPPYCGQKFIAVYGSGWSPRDRDVHHAIYEEYAINVTLSQRVSDVPYDRRGEEIYIKTLTGMESYLSRVVHTLHRSYGVLQAANALILADNPDDPHPIVEPLRWLGSDPAPIPVFSDWFIAENVALEDAQVGFTLTARFGMALRPIALAY